MKEEKKDNKNKIFTVPNLLSVFRLLLIPIIIVCYFASGKNRHLFALIVFGVSALTDVLDGFIARKFNMISDVGKILDPIADKLTQLALALCLAIESYIIHPLLTMLVIKDFLIGLTSLIATKRSNDVEGAAWHGKLSTVLLFAVIAMHLIWFDNLPIALSHASIGVSIIMMIVTLVLYLIRNTKMCKQASLEQKSDLTEESVSPTNVPTENAEDVKNANLG